MVLKAIILLHFDTAKCKLYENLKLDKIFIVIRALPHSVNVRKIKRIKKVSTFVDLSIIDIFIVFYYTLSKSNFRNLQASNACYFKFHSLVSDFPFFCFCLFVSFFPPKI